MKTKIFIFGLVVIILFSSGCQTSQQQGGTGIFSKVFGSKDTSTTPFQEYRVGTEGISVEFSKEFPPSKVLQQNPMNLLLEVKNKGAYSVIPNDIFLLVRTSEQGIKIAPKLDIKSQIKEAFGGKRAEKPQGDIIQAEYSVDNSFIPMRDQETITFDAKLCYNYETILNENKFCIAPSGKAYSGGEICTLPQTYTYSGGQGAPIAITKVIEEAFSMTDGKFMLVIQIFISDSSKEGKVTGGEYAYNVREYETGGFDESKCSKAVYSTNKKINLKEVKFSEYSYTSTTNDKKISCTPEKLELIKSQTQIQGQELENRNRIICKVVMEEQPKAFTTPLSIELQYGYEARVTKDVIIQKTSHTTTSGGVFCPEERCFSKSLWGVGTGTKGNCYVYGGEDKTNNCQDSTRICCLQSKTRCESEKNLKCDVLSKCPVKEGKPQYYPELCPGNTYCCMAST